MDEIHKDAIQRNYKTLVDSVNLRELLPLLLQKKVFSPDQSEKYRNPSTSEKEHKRHLFLHIQRRGPNAFRNLIQSLEEMDSIHRNLAALLQGREITEQLNQKNNNYENEDPEGDTESIARPFGQQRGAWPYQLPPGQRPVHIRQLSHEFPNANINLGMEPLKINVKYSERFYDDRKASSVPVYSMRSKQRGIFLCINNIEFGNISKPRQGAEVDEENLKTLFRDMGFSIEAHRNQSHLDTKRTFQNFVDSAERLKQVDCVIIAVMSHGDEGHTKESSHIITSDEKKLEVSWILEQFNNRNCPALICKPKIFLFQICRGDNLHVGVKVHPHEARSIHRPLPMPRIESDGYVQSPKVVRDAEDMLIAFSTLPGDRSYRDTMLGTWYMQAICKIFMNDAHNIDIENCLRKVDFEIRKLRSAEGNMQTSSFENRGFHLCYLHPGIYEDEHKRLRKYIET